MNKDKANQIAQQITQLLLTTELSEAEAVYAILVGTTMRLAVDSKTVEELQHKINAASKLFNSYLPSNIEAFRRAIEAKNNLEQKQ